jgi:hypothetical protein
MSLTIALEGRFGRRKGTADVDNTATAVLTCDEYRGANGSETFQR